MALAKALAEDFRAWCVAFNVSLFKAGRNQEDVVYRSKAVGEPPLIMRTNR